MNALPPGPIRWVNQLSIPSVAGLVMQVVWLYGSVRFTGVAANLLLRDGLQTEIHHSYGLQLAIALLVAWTGGKVTNALSNFGVRKTAREYKEADSYGKERARLAETADHAAIHVAKADQVIAPASEVQALPDEDHQWRGREDPTEGLG